MGYSKKNWEDLPDITTPITATDLDRMEEGIADANGAIGVDAYDSTATYDVNDLCIKDNTLYICTTAITTAEAWNSAHWKTITIDDMLISKIETNSIVTELNKLIDFDCLHGVIEKGSNENGEYIKFGDGTLIQYGKFYATTGSNRGTIEGWNLGVYVYETTKSFPINFINTNSSIFGSTNSANPYIYSAGIFNINTVSSFTFRAISSNSNYERPFSWIAIGRWK